MVSLMWKLQAWADASRVSTAWLPLFKQGQGEVQLG